MCCSSAFMSFPDGSLATYIVYNNEDKNSTKLYVSNKNAAHPYSKPLNSLVIMIKKIQETCIVLH